MKRTEPKIPPVVGRLVGYARVSTVEQNIDMQIKALRAHGVEERDLFVEKLSASARKRPQFEWMMEHSLRRGDTLVVWRLDRLIRSLMDLLTIMQSLRDRGVNFRSLTENIDLDTPHGQLMLGLIGSLAQWERDVIKQRTRAGVKAAQARGVRFGQPPRVSLDQQRQIRKWKRQNPKLTVRTLADRVWLEFGVKVSHTTIVNYLRPKPKKATE